ncbi:MAG: zf-HC2 domain-containing protein [Planctomycetes bacterium]|nr:zf-HC2 domain-containing protein [Planctomycetota bacterium]
MNCEQGLSLISALMDGELLPDDRHRLTAHLAECANCRVAMDDWERDDRELAQVFGVRKRAASAVADRVLEAWFEEASSSSRQRGHWKLASAAAAGFAMAFLLFGARTWIGSSGGDLDERVHALVAEWKKGDAPYELELRLRSLGPACAAPLADVVQAWEGEANDAGRLGIARVLCDVADASQIPTLIELLGDPSFEIRTASEASLVRLTGRREVGPMGPVPPEAASCSNPQVDWREWWDKNKERFDRSDR